MHRERGDHLHRRAGAQRPDPGVTPGQLLGHRQRRARTGQDRDEALGPAPHRGGQLVRRAGRGEHDGTGLGQQLGQPGALDDGRRPPSAPARSALGAGVQGGDPHVARPAGGQPGLHGRSDVPTCAWTRHSPVPPMTRTESPSRSRPARRAATRSASAPSGEESRTYITSCVGPAGSSGGPASAGHHRGQPVRVLGRPGCPGRTPRRPARPGAPPAPGHPRPPGHRGRAAGPGSRRGPVERPRARPRPRRPARPPSGRRRRRGDGTAGRPRTGGGVGDGQDGAVDRPGQGTAGQGGRAAERGGERGRVQPVGALGGVGEPAQELGHDRPRVAARAEQGGVGQRAAHRAQVRLRRAPRSRPRRPAPRPRRAPCGPGWSRCRSRRRGRR